MPAKPKAKTNFFADNLLNAKIIFFLLLAVMTIVVIVFVEVPLVTVNNAAHQRLVSMGWLLFPHIIFAVTAFLIGPFQFSLRLRKKNVRLHRRLGRIYSGAVFLAAIFAVLTNLKYPAPGQTATATVQAMTQPGVWFITTLMAWITAMKRQITLHKIWMSRSYGVTFIFITSRVILPFPFFSSMDANSFITVLWFLIIVALIVPEILLNWKEIFMSRKKVVVKMQPVE